VLAAAPAARAQAGPDFDAVTNAGAWMPLGCGKGAATNVTPADIDLIGDATHPAAYVAYDTNFLYFRYRVAGDPSGPGGFDQLAWNALMQAPTSKLYNPFQYQYELSFLGKNDTIQIWANTSPEDVQQAIQLFNDPAETRLFWQPYNPPNQSPLARSLKAVGPDGSAFGYFLDFAFPIAILRDNGVIQSANDLGQALFYPATAADPNNYNKAYFSCGAFEATTTLAIDTSVTPAAVPANTTTAVQYDITVKNTGTTDARGVIIKDSALPSYLANATCTVNPPTEATCTVNPLEVRVPSLPAGSIVTVQISADATPHCTDDSFSDEFTVSATNAVPVTKGAFLPVDLTGCACQTAANCNDMNACTTDTCVQNRCAPTAVAGCTPCTTAADCPDDGNACTTAACTNGACTSVPTPGCTRCASDADCNDANACTTDSCVAGACSHVAVAGCSNPGGGGTGNPGSGSGNPGQGGSNGGTSGDDLSQHASKEICGDCIDNDGDGLVDYDDPDCCAALTQLQLKRLVLTPGAKKPNGRRLVMKARRLGFTPTDFQPMSGATLQISDSSGTLFCQKMPASGWKHKGRSRVFTFRDKKGTLAGGLRLSRFTMKKNGTVVFTTAGKNVTLRPTDGHDVRVTLAVSGQCMQSTNQLRAKRRAVVFP
jgi:uncharacterized repeat protein (TIGR01451 family)